MSRRPHRSGLLILASLLSFPLQAQAPLASDATRALQDAWLAEAVSRPSQAPGPDGATLSAGLLSVSWGEEDVWMPLVHGAGLGTVTLGNGLVASGQWTRRGWELSATWTALRNREDGSVRGRLNEFSLVRRTPGGWRWGVEKKPFQWGYGLFGGYLIGDAHDPVPRLVLESPLKALHLFGVPLGSWGFDTFLGQLEWNRKPPAWSSEPGVVQETLATQGDIRRPNLSGFRLRAAFGPNVDMNFGVVSRWGGVNAKGRNIMSGLSWWNYPLGYLGAENLLVAEASGNLENPDPAKRFVVPPTYHDISNAVADVELRIRFPETAARWFGAKGLALYLSRGANNVNWQWKTFLRHPFSAWSHDLRFVGHQLGRGAIFGSGPDSLLGWSFAEGSPALTHINDTVGVQWVFDRWDLGLELSDTHNLPYPGSTYRAYENSRFISGHSRYGDSLGEPLGAEVYQQGFRLGTRLPRQGRLSVLVLDAIRFYRDSPLVLTNFRPGVDDHFFHAQTDLQWVFPSQARLGGSFAFERHQALDFVAGNRRSNWILSLGYGIPILRR